MISALLAAYLTGRPPRVQALVGIRTLLARSPTRDADAAVAGTAGRHRREEP